MVRPRYMVLVARQSHSAGSAKMNGEKLSGLPDTGLFATAHKRPTLKASKHSVSPMNMPCA